MNNEIHSQAGFVSVQVIFTQENFLKLNELAKAENRSRTKVLKDCIILYVLLKSYEDVLPEPLPQPLEPDGKTVPIRFINVKFLEKALAALKLKGQQFGISVDTFLNVAVACYRTPPYKLVLKDGRTLSLNNRE